MRALTTPQFIKAAKSVHGSKYGYHKVDYQGSQIKVVILCSKHGDFEQLPDTHINRGAGCPQCNSINRVNRNKARAKTTNKFIQKAKVIHGKKYKYSKVKYLSARTKVVITCEEHGDFKQIPISHLNGHGCPRCNLTSRYSKLAVKWIEEYAYSHRLKGVQHALNGGEYIIPGTRWKVDGYHPRSNTVFEFHGDAWHGNPKVFSPRSKPNPFKNKTAQRLYKETKARERLIRKLGYKLVTIWESDYHGYEWD